MTSVDSVTSTTTSLGVQTTVVDSSSPSSLLSPLYENTSNYDNIQPSSSTTLHPSRPIPITIEEDLTLVSVAQQTIEVHRDEIRDVVVRGAVRSRPVTTGARSRDPHQSSSLRSVSIVIPVVHSRYRKFDLFANFLTES